MIVTIIRMLDSGRVGHGSWVRSIWPDPTGPTSLDPPWPDPQEKNKTSTRTDSRSQL